MPSDCEQSNFNTILNMVGSCRRLSRDCAKRVVRKNSCSLGFQLIFMVQSTQDRMAHNLKAVGNAMPMFLELDGETGWRLRESWPTMLEWGRP